MGFITVNGGLRRIIASWPLGMFFFDLYIYSTNTYLELHYAHKWSQWQQKKGLETCLMCLEPRYVFFFASFYFTNGYITYRMLLHHLRTKQIYYSWNDPTNGDSRAKWWGTWDMSRLMSQVCIFFVLNIFNTIFRLDWPYQWPGTWDASHLMSLICYFISLINMLTRDKLVMKKGSRHVVTCLKPT